MAVAEIYPDPEFRDAAQRSFRSPPPEPAAPMSASLNEPAIALANALASE